MRKGGIRSTRGATLLEVCIVLAVMAVMMTTVVSFSVLTARQVERVRVRQMRDSDLYDAEALVREWISYFDRADYRLDRSAGGDLFAESRSDPSVSYALWVEDGALCAEFPGGLRTRGAYGSITGLSASEVCTSADGRVLLSCTLSADGGTAGEREICILVKLLLAGREEGA